MSGSARLDLPFLSAGQAGKEFVHNEALQTLDLLTAAAVEEGPRNTPPATPSIGACYIVGVAPTDQWAGKAGYLAGYTSGGWRFIAPTDGMTALVKSSGIWGAYRSGSWDIGTIRGVAVVLGGTQILGSQLPAIAGPTGGTVADTESRATINQILDALRQHGLIAV
jgi:hypothetical protein